MVCWPLKNCKPLFPDAVGMFGAIRSHDIHTGIDLYCELGAEVVAMQYGTVVSIEDFTGTLAAPPTPLWNNTKAILVYHKTHIAVYGEVSPRVEIGQQVREGEVIAVVDTPVLKEFKGRPMVMLHFESMKCHEDPKTLTWELGAPKPFHLVDPWCSLSSAAIRQLGRWLDDRDFFDLSTYDGKSFRV